MSLRKNRLAVSLAYALMGCTSIALVPQAFAQDAPAADPAGRTATDLDAVTVTAQSREPVLA